MKKPQMILFDYGQTLIDEGGFDGEKGSAKMLEIATRNKYGLTPKEVQQKADELSEELGRFGENGQLLMKEIPNEAFNRLLYETLGIEFSIPFVEREMLFWESATHATPSLGIEEFLAYLQNQGIRSAVISNISYSGQSLTKRIQKLLPDNNFEFILATSDYIVRKPGKRIFQVALEKAELSPEEVWYVGDSYEIDVEGARNAGLTPIWYQGAPEGEFPKHDDVWTVKSFRELMQKMEE